MSFLDILGTVEGAKAPTTIPDHPRPAQAAPKKPNALTQNPLLAKNAVGQGPATRPVQTNGASQLKRKADGDLGPPRPKTQRTNTGDNVGQPSTTAKPNTSSGQPYRGTAGLERPKAVPRSVQPTARPTNAPSSTAQASAKPSAPQKPAATATAQPNNTAKPPPKKGSYAEILARAATTQTTYTGIKHKTMEEIKKAKPIPPKDKGKPDPRAKPGARRPGSAELQSGSEKDRLSANRGGKPAKPGYQGTARAVPAAAPARPAYQGTMGKRAPDVNANRPGVPGRNTAKAKGPGAASKRYEYYDSEDEDEDEDDYASDGSSDMEANMFDVDREEEEALRAAKREDADEAAHLAALEREKKRRRQLAVAQSLKEKKERRRFM